MGRIKLIKNVTVNIFKMISIFSNNYILNIFLLIKEIQIFLFIIVSKNIKQQNKNVSWVENRHIRMISERSRDTEDWSNNAENSALHYLNYILK